MPNKSYNKGRRFEWIVQKRLKDMGFYVVRNPKSQFPDLTAIGKDGKIMAIECKIGGKLSRGEKEKFQELKKKFHLVDFELCIAKPGESMQKFIIEPIFGNK